METIKRNIEKAFLNIYSSSVNQTELKPFDFYSAIKSLERKNDTDFGLYIGVFKDLFSVIGHTFIEYKSITQKGDKYIVVREWISIFSNLPLKTEHEEKEYSEPEFTRRFKSSDIQILNKSGISYPIIKIFYLCPAIEKGRGQDFYKLREYIKSKQSANTENIVFEEYVKELEMQYSQIQVLELKEQESPPDHSSLFKELSTYISGITAIGFSHIITHHSLPPDGTLRANWIGIPADAYRFATFLNMKTGNFDKCFGGLTNKQGNPRKLKHSDKNETDSPITAILKYYFPK